MLCECGQQADPHGRLIAEGANGPTSFEADAILAEMNDLGPKIERAVTVEGKLAKSSEQRQSAGRVSGIVPNEGAEEQERRATSALMAVMSVVPDFSKALLGPLGAPAGVPATATITAKNTGMGMPARRVCPIQLKDSGMPYSVVPSVTMNASPPTVVIVARVATMAEIPR